MVQRTNGGVFDQQILTGTLAHYILYGADFSGALDSNGKPVPFSAAEIIFTNITASAYIDIMNPNSRNISFALEAGRSDWDDVTLTQMVRSLGTDVGVDHINCSVCVVERVPYIWGLGGGGATSFLELTDVPSSYIGAENWTVVVNSAGTGLTFSPSSAITLDYIPVAPGALLSAGQKYFVTSAGVVRLPLGTGNLAAGSSITITKKSQNPQSIVFIDINTSPDIIATQLGNTDSIEMDAPEELVFIFDGTNTWNLQIGSVN